jgi:hypothetical protein
MLRQPDLTELAGPSDFGSRRHQGRREQEMRGPAEELVRRRSLHLRQERTGLLERGRAMQPAVRPPGDGTRHSTLLHQSACRSSGRQRPIRQLRRRWRPSARSRDEVWLRSRTAEIIASRRGSSASSSLTSSRRRSSFWDPRIAFEDCRPGPISGPTGSQLPVSHPGVGWFWPFPLVFLIHDAEEAFVLDQGKSSQIDVPQDVSCAAKAGPEWDLGGDEFCSRLCHVASGRQSSPAIR